MRLLGKRAVMIELATLGLAAAFVAIGYTYASQPDDAYIEAVVRQSTYLMHELEVLPSMRITDDRDSRA